MAQEAESGAIAQIDLRPYQERSKLSLREAIANGSSRVVLYGPTGCGKTVMAADLLRSAYLKGSRAVFIVDRVALCEQTSEVLWQYNIPHGILMAGATRRMGEPIIVASAQTIEKRGFPRDLDLIIVDECHAKRKSIEQYILTHTIPTIGLTATPFTKGMSSVYDGIVSECTTNQLIGEGYLAPLKVYAAKPIDMTGAKTTAGEWTGREVEKRGIQIVGDIVSTWREKTNEHFGGPVKTLVFSATVEHGYALAEQFNAAGFRFEQISYRDSDDERRKRLIREIKSNDSDLMGLISCELLAKGFDAPNILCGISSRPYRRSLSAHIQQLGRVMRGYPGKDFALWLDHTGNYLRFKDDVDDVFQNGVHRLLDGRETPKNDPPKEDLAEKRCASCGYVLELSAKVCPVCGHEIVRRSKVTLVDGTIIEVDKSFAGDKSKEWLWKQVCGVAMERMYTGHQAKLRRRRFALAQYKNLTGEWPPKAWDFQPCKLDMVSDDVRRKVDGNVRRYIIARHKAAQKNA